MLCCAAAPRVELAGRLHDDDGQQHIQCFFSPLPLLCGGPHQPPRRDAGGSVDADGRNRALALGGFLFFLSLSTCREEKILIKSISRSW